MDLLQNQYNLDLYDISIRNMQNLNLNLSLPLLMLYLINLVNKLPAIKLDIFIFLMIILLGLNLEYT
jgi:hypothetical protein